MVLFSCTVFHCNFSNYTAESVVMQVGLADWEINIYDSTHNGDALGNVSYSTDSTIMTLSYGSLGKKSLLCL